MSIELSNLSPAEGSVKSDNFRRGRGHGSGNEDGAVVDVDALVESGVVRNPKDGVKILGNGDITKKLTVKANAFSASAKEKIEAAGGTAEVI